MREGILPIVRINDDLVYDNILDYSFQNGMPQYIQHSGGGYVVNPPDINLNITFRELPDILLRYAINSHIIDKVILDYGEGKTIEFWKIIVDHCDYDQNIYNISMRALRMSIFQSEQEKRESDLMCLINTGQINIGVKK